MDWTGQSTEAMHRVYDVVGIGFGPSNLALAIAIEEHNEAAGAGGAISARFLERQPAFGWHRGMLLPGATMQVSFLKDLATLRNPRTTFSFVSYLHDAGRLTEFINHKSLFPSRLEFHDYLEWAAARVRHLVGYGAEVVDVRPVHGDDGVECLEVVTRCTQRPGELIVTRARNLVVATGLAPQMPERIERSARVWHSCELLPRLDALAAGRDEPQRFVVVGAGQSAAEVTEHLHSRFPTAEICSVLSRYGYSPADDSPFANGIFDPDAVDTFFHADPAARRMLVDYHANTNYSVVDLELIEELYRRAYQERVQGRERLRWVNISRVTDVHETPAGVVAVIRSLADGESSLLEADAIVFATGYAPADPAALLGSSEPLCLRAPDGGLRIERDYRVATAPDVAAGIYVQGASEHLHGLSASLLSNTAVRAGEVLRSLLAAPRPVDAASLVTSHA